MNAIPADQNPCQQDQLREALDQHAIVSVTDRQGNILEVNDLFCHVSGFSRGELLGQNHRLLKSGMHDDDFYADMWRSIRQGRTWKGEICNRRKDGGLYWVASTITPFLDKRGQPYQFISIRTDITDRVMAEREAALQKERLRTGQLFANIGTWELNLESGELFWTERVAPLFGYAPGELATSYDNFMNAVHPDDRERVKSAVSQCLKEHSVYSLEHRVTWPDGSVHWVLERGSVVEDMTGKAVRMIGIVQDINDRKQAELALAEREKELLDAQAMANVGSWRGDFRTQELQWSDQAFRIFGYEPGTVPASTGLFWRHIHPDDRQRVEEGLAGAVATGRLDFRHRIITRLNEERHVHVLAKVEADENGEMTAITGAMQDITQGVFAEQALIRAREEADKANRAKSEFLSSMSHELRTPLNAILGFAQLLEYDDNLNELQRDSVEEIIRAGKHLLVLINDILDLARIESGEVPLSMEAVPLDSVITECLRLMTGMAARRGIGLEFEDGQHAFVRADYTRLKQVMLNLISNAIKYNREGGNVCVSIETDPARWTQHISVTDTGHGIPAEKLDGLFQPFNRLGREGSNIEGSGIGLNISKRILEMMEGDITVTSVPGEGSCFQVSLPRATPPGITVEPPPTGAGTQERSRAAGGQYRVVYIEDNSANLKLVSSILAQSTNIELYTAQDGITGIDLVREKAPHLVLIDLNLPGLDGYEVMSRLRHGDHGGRLICIAVSARAMKEDIQRGRNAGFDDYVVKPLDVDHFRSRIQHWLEQLEAGSGDTGEVG